MVRMESYKKAAEDKYWECVNSVIDLEEQQKIITSCIKYMPPDFFSENVCFKELVLAPYEKIKNAYQYIEKDKQNMERECFVKNEEGKLERTELYKKLYDTYEKISQKLVNKVKMNVFLVKQTGFTVCPYCNRDYINNRSERLSGAQMDHFYPRAKYPIFSVCLYNLVPACNNCNRIKSDSEQELASPFDKKIDWENNIIFSYEFLDIDRKKIVIDAKGKIKNNIEVMHIEEAYQIHETEINELLEKARMYSKTQLEEFGEVLGKTDLTEPEIKRMVFGNEITEESMKRRPLGRMMRDLERELGIYK